MAPFVEFREPFDAHICHLSVWRTLPLISYGIDDILHRGKNQYTKKLPLGLGLHIFCKFQKDLIYMNKYLTSWGLSPSGKGKWFQILFCTNSVYFLTSLRPCKPWIRIVISFVWARKLRDFYSIYIIKFMTIYPSWLLCSRSLIGPQMTYIAKNGVTSMVQKSNLKMSNDLDFICSICGNFARLQIMANDAFSPRSKLFTKCQ